MRHTAPFTVGYYMEKVRRSTRGVEASLRGFEQHEAAVRANVAEKQYDWCVEPNDRSGFKHLRSPCFLVSRQSTGCCS